MKSDLQILIDEVQKEHDFLEGEMNSCVRDLDFLGAEAFRKIFFLKKEELRMVKNLDNPNHGEIQNLKRILKKLSKPESEDEFLKSLKKRWGAKIQESKNKDEILKSLIKRRKANIQEYESKLLKLESAVRKPYQDSEELMIGLEHIFSNKINRLEIIVEEEEVMILILKQKKSLMIEIKATDKHFWNRSKLATLKRIGFEVNEENVFQKNKELEKTDIPQVLEILSRVFFEVFRFHRVQKVLIKY